MPAIHTVTALGHASRLTLRHARLKKVLVLALFVLALFSTRAFADEKLLISYSLASLRAQTALGFHFPDFKALKLPSTKLNLSDGISERTQLLARSLESLPLDLFQPRSQRFSRFEPGIGSYFPGDTIGRSRTSGSGLEENRWIYFKLKFRF